MKKRLLRQLCRALNLSADFIRRYKRLFKALLEEDDGSGSGSSGGGDESGGGGGGGGSRYEPFNMIDTVCSGQGEVYLITKGNLKYYYQEMDNNINYDEIYGFTSIHNNNNMLGRIDMCAERFNSTYNMYKIDEVYLIYPFIGFITYKNSNFPDKTYTQLNLIYLVNDMNTDKNFFVVLEPYNNDKFNNNDVAIGISVLTVPELYVQI